VEAFTKNVYSKVKAVIRPLHSGRSHYPYVVVRGSPQRQALDSLNVWVGVPEIADGLKGASSLVEPNDANSLTDALDQVSR